MARGAALVLVPLPRPKEAAGTHLPTLLQGNPPSRALRFSLLRCGEHPRGYPDVASGRCTGTLRQRGRERLPGKRGRTRTAPQRGKAVSSEVTSGCPKRSEGGFPVGTRTITTFPSGTQAEHRLPSESREKETCLVARLLPGLAPADLHIQRNAQAGGTAHLLDEHTFGGFTLAGGNLENDFVVNLQQHAGLQTLLA